MSGTDHPITLVVLPRFPSERTGTGQRSRLLMEGAHAVGPVHVVVLDGARAMPDPADVMPGLASMAAFDSDRVTPRRGLARILGGAVRVLQPARSYGVEPALHANLTDHIARHSVDTVIFRYARLYCAAGIEAGQGLRVFVDVDDRDDQKYATLLNGALGSKLAAAAPFRARLAHLATLLQTRLARASAVWFAAPEDIWPLAPARTALLPNVPYWPKPKGIVPPSGTDEVLLFVGIHDHQPNRDGIRWFLDQVWPDIVAARPAARIRIIGRGKWSAMQATYAQHKGVDFVGEVADLAAEYAQARLAICPVRQGGGSKIKVIEAAAFGRPVVAVPHALRGFAGLDGTSGAIAADRAPDFAAACCAWLADPAAAAQAGQELSAWQSDHYSREAFVDHVATALAPPSAPASRSAP
ncbi:glycosyltransferase [Gymnodinialimonas sp. 2305UL16-5]|uniref:glycosyltransferase n=1 Tax=Gymnodinialimonas mytili TaxID=3126503 RepID=UPI0030A1E3F8